jgi:hypothetical protein
MSYSTDNGATWQIIRPWTQATTGTLRGVSNGGLIGTSVEMGNGVVNFVDLPISGAGTLLVRFGGGFTPGNNRLVLPNLNRNMSLAFTATVAPVNIVDPDPEPLFSAEPSYEPAPHNIPSSPVEEYMALPEEDEALPKDDEETLEDTE